jgi:hypothetical protein
LLARRNNRRPANNEPVGLAILVRDENEAVEAGILVDEELREAERQGTMATLCVTSRVSGLEHIRINPVHILRL